jgi:hypothetical protein
MSLAAHITVHGYHTRWFSEYLHVPHGLVIPLWSGASYEDHELFVSKLQNMGVNAVLTRHREKHGGRWYEYFVYVPSTHLGELEKQVSQYMPTFALYLLKPQY